MGLLIGIGNTKPLFPYDYCYGIEWDTEKSTPTCTRIGRSELHASLPVQSQMRRCMLNDEGKVVYYLHPTDSTKRDTGAAAKLDGSDGQVMVELPAYYYRCEMEGSRRRYLMSTHELPGFTHVPKRYVSAYECTIERSAEKLASVVNKTAGYRGGNNQEDWDSLPNSQLGMPATNMNITNARKYARNRGSVSWNCYTYDIVKTLYWFFTVEYATLNCQLDFNPVLSSEGYRQGGLGTGVTTINSAMWTDFNGQYPVIPCGVTNSLGNATGTVTFSMPEEYSATILSFNVPSYRGVENPFGHVWHITDGCKVRIQSDDAGGETQLYVCNNPAFFQDTDYNMYGFQGLLSRKSGYIKEILFGEFADIFPLVVGGSSTTYFSDNFYTSIPTTDEVQRIVLFGGYASNNLYAGFVFSNTNLAASSSSQNVGTRLSFYPTIK